MNDHHYAIVVGINRYPGISDLSGPRADAEEFADWLADPAGGGLKPEHIKQVIVSAADEAGFATAQAAKPTNLEIDYALQDIVKTIKTQLTADASSWDESRLYLYAAGHGFAPQGGEGALFLANAEPDALARNIELIEYRRWCTACAWAREVIVFADCCRTRIRTSVRGFAPGLNECPAPWNGKASTWLVGFGSTFGNPTYENDPAPGSDDQARGYFTAALLEGLRGGAPRDEEGALTAANLSSYVKAIVAERTRDQPYPQDVEISGPLAESISFGTAAPPPQRQVTIQFPAGFAGPAAIIKDGRGLLDWDKTSPWRVALADGLYEVDGGAFENDGVFKVAGEDRNVKL